MTRAGAFSFLGEEEGEGKDPNANIDIIEKEQISKERMSEATYGPPQPSRCLRMKGKARSGNRRTHCSMIRYLVLVECFRFFSFLVLLLFYALFRKSRIETETCLFINADYYLLAFV